MADNRRDKDRRFFFTRGQLFLLAGSFTVTALIVFFLGIVVGKDIEARRVGKTDQPLAKFPVKPGAASVESPPPPAPAEELTYYDTSAKAAPTDPSAEAKGQESKPADKPKAEPVTAKSQSKEDPPTAKPKKTEKPAPVSEAKPTTIAETTSEVKDKEAAEGWTVQVNAYPDERSARQLVDRLKSKGYNATVTEARNNGKLWYRVRVGRYASKEEAKKLEETLRTNENFAKAFATSR
jgi:cell division septation protein DedD